jgi:predicted DsbA family dithiol-disulfide isomerase
MTARGEELGFTFSFVDGFRMHNTFNAHQLLYWANEQSRQHDLKQAFFIAHFTNRRDLSNEMVLAEITADIGLDHEEAASVLADQRFAAEVRQEQNFWMQQGITGVPAIVFDRKHLVTGAQGVDNFRSVLNQLQKIKHEGSHG